MTDDPIEALLRQADPLPAPAERLRLRTAGDLPRTRVADAVGVTAATVAKWEAGTSTPSGEQRAVYSRLLSGLADRYPAPAEPAAPAPVKSPAESSAVPVEDDVQDVVEPSTPASPRSRPGRAQSTASPRRRATAAASSAPGPAAAGGRFTAGPLAVLDGQGVAHLADGRNLECPADTVPDLVAWALETGLGQERLHRHGRDADPLVVLTADATARLGLPERLADRRGLRLPEDHPVVQDIATAGWQLTKRGFGPWPRIYRPADDGRRQCVQLAVLPWEALDARTWSTVGTWPATDIARTLGAYATRVLTPRGSTAVTGLELMTALRSPTRPVRDEDGGWTSGLVPGSLTHAVDPAPPEAPEEHPVAQGRPADGALDEEAYEWVRAGELLTDAECQQPHAVGIDVNMAFAAAANRLHVGLGPAIHTDGPRFDKAIPGSWLVDLSEVETDPRLPSPFTPTGARPTGPGWYATPTLAYAAEIGADVRPLEAWLRPEAGPYLDPWYARLRNAYLATMATAGITKDLTDEEFLAAMATDRHPGTAAVLTAIKATVKGGLGKLRERPQGAGYRPGQRWPALERPTWRPDIRAAVIAQARTNMHRKMARMATAGLFPLAVLSDCAVYPAAGPSPLNLLPTDPATGKPLSGAFRLGVSPGMVKHEGTMPLWRAVELLESGANPARHIKDTDTTEEA